MALFDMAFEGGGAKGSAFVGALEMLEAKGHKHRRLIGTSAGANTATLVAAGPCRSGIPPRPGVSEDQAKRLTPEPEGLQSSAPPAQRPGSRIPPPEPPVP
jgi:hypothetical protein